jgi:hypothetical protein
MDAASPAPSTLLAVHHPARIRKRAVGSTDEGQLVGEREVLDHFLDPSYPLMLLPVLGEAGTGKSHLVQWLRAQMDETPSRRVIYVPRSGTGLRGLIDLILEQMEGPEALRLREQLATAFGSTDRSLLPAQLLDVIAQEIPNVADDGSEARDLRRRRGLARDLPPLFRDEVFRRWFLRPGGVIERLVDAVLDEGVRPLSERSGFAFSVEDFPEADRLGDFERIGGFAQDAFAHLSSARVFRETAADLSTGALDRAIPRVFGLTGETTLDSVFRETRRILGQRGMELVVLIEDLTRFQGVDRSLVDALLEPPIQDGARVLCDLRAAVAVTSGYFARFLDTFASRAHYGGFEFVLDTPYGDPTRGWSDPDIADFVSRYLNASRIEASELKRSYDVAGPLARTDGSWIPSACEDCPHRVPCHEAFGAVDGRGLYPFNADALRAAAISIFTDGQFDPRGLLGRLVHTTLASYASDIQHGRFPSTSFAAGFPDAPPLPGTAATECARYPERDKREVLLRFWGGAPDHLSDLNLGIHTAFAIPPVGLVQSPSSPPPQPGQGPELPLPPPAPTPPSGLEDLVARWASGQPLPRHATQSLQQALYKAVVACVPWAALGIRPNHPYFVEKAGARIFRPYSIHIEDGLGTERANTTVTVALTREDRDMLHFLARADGLGSATALGPQGYSTIRAYVDDLARQVTVALANAVDPASPGNPVDALVDRLAVGALALGIAENAHDPLDLARATLENLPSAQAPAATRWASLTTELKSERRETQLVLTDLTSTRQGASPRPSMFRVGRVARRVARLIETWELSVARDLPDRFHERLGRLSSRDLRSTIDDECSRLTEAAAALRSLLGDVPVTSAGLAHALLGAIDDAESVNCLPANPIELRRLVENLERAPVDDWRRVTGRLPQPEEPIGDRLAAIASIQALHLQEGLAILRHIDEALNSAERTVADRLDELASGTAASPLDDAIAAIRRLTTALETGQS